MLQKISLKSPVYGPGKAAYFSAFSKCFAHPGLKSLQVLWFCLETILVLQNLISGRIFVWLSVWISCSYIHVIADMCIFMYCTKGWLNPWQEPLPLPFDPVLSQATHTQFF